MEPCFAAKGPILESLPSLKQPHCSPSPRWTPPRRPRRARFVSEGDAADAWTASTEATRWLAGPPRCSRRPGTAEARASSRSGMSWGSELQRNERAEGGGLKRRRERDRARALRTVSLLMSEQNCPRRLSSPPSHSEARSVAGSRGGPGLPWPLRPLDSCAKVRKTGRGCGVNNQVENTRVSVDDPVTPPASDLRISKLMDPWF